MTNEPEEPKLIIDEDWKSQVEREKREAEAEKSKSDASTTESTETPVTEPKSTPGPGEQKAAPEQEIPPASIPMLVTSLATQALASMGQMPGEEESMPVNLNFARHFIDLIGLLEEKTKGNLSEGELTYLTDTLHQLRMMFVAVQAKNSE